MKTITLIPLLALLLVSGCAWEDFDLPLHMYLPASFGATATPADDARPNRALDRLSAETLAADVQAALAGQMASTGHYMSVHTAATETPPETDLVMYATLRRLEWEVKELSHCGRAAKQAALK